MNRASFNRRLLAWHRANARPLEIREAATPWQVLVAEVMSQQTTIGRVGPAWRAFIARWPGPAELARASSHDLLAVWSGLGYNRRALALREAARTIVRDHDGHVPADIALLESLPGIGPYTARAVAASAFGIATAPLDVNVRRVLGRVHGAPGQPAGGPAAAALQAQADTLVDRRDPRAWVNAVMDLAASVCTRRAPRCDACPVARQCASRGTPGDIATRRPRPPFASTNRWLRGRLLATLTAADRDRWVEPPAGLGVHGPEAIVAGLRALERDGFLELRDGRARLRADDGWPASPRGRPRAPRAAPPGGAPGSGGPARRTARSARSSA